MNEIGAAASAAAGAQPPQNTARVQRVRQAASEFEGLLIAQMLRSARSATSLTSLDGEESGSSDAVTEFAEQQLSGTLASAGGLGLATLVARGLHEPPSTAPSQPVGRAVEPPAE